jgi:NADH dehydrogenase
MLERMAMVLPAMPISGRGEALYQPIWAEDVADCVMGALRLDPSTGAARERFELAGPQTLSHAAIVELVLRAAGRSRPTFHVPATLVRGALRVAETLLKSRAPATWDEAELLEVSMTSVRGVADPDRLGVTPRRMSAVLGVAG